MIEEELIEHVDDCRNAARRYSLPGAPGVDPLDQLGRDPKVDICGFPFHTEEVSVFGHSRLIIPAKELISSTYLAICTSGRIPIPRLGNPPKTGKIVCCQNRDYHLLQTSGLVRS
jgi:hypothetical protein